MKIPFLGGRPEKRGAVDPEGIAELLAECELLRSLAFRAGVRLDDLLPRWRDDPEVLPWLGDDAGLYLGTVLVRTVPGASWMIRADGQPLVRLASGREFDVVAAGHEWAVNGVPELSQWYGEVAET